MNMPTSFLLTLNELNQRRRQLGMSYAVLARRSGVSLPTVQRILSGKHRMPGLASVVAIAQALGANLQLDALSSVEEFREQQARRKAERLVGMVQATSGLAG